MQNSVRICKYNFGKIKAGRLSVKLNFEIVKVLDVQLQYNDLVVWAEENTDYAASQDSKIEAECVWTGFAPPGAGESNYFTTVTDDSGQVYHVYLLHKVHQE